MRLLFRALEPIIHLQLHKFYEICKIKCIWGFIQNLCPHILVPRKSRPSKKNATN
jgi:hypothetical protein